MIQHAGMQSHLYLFHGAATTLSVAILSIMTLSITKHTITTFSITNTQHKYTQRNNTQYNNNNATLSIMTHTITTLSTTNTRHNYYQHNIFLNATLSIKALNTGVFYAVSLMQSVILANVMLNVIALPKILTI